MTEDPLVGRQLGNFRIDRLLGRGGMASVYCGWDVKLERPVAIKVIDARYQDDPAYAERFVREARAVATWRHENIVQIYYADDQDGFYYFVMEFIDGMDLGGLLSEYAQIGELMPHEDVLVIGRAIASALDYAHREGIIHRDVKPGNVMVDRNDRVILTDFGLAMDVAQGSLGEVFGSSHYIAPEQAHKSADAVSQSDLYSLGVVFYQMLTGDVPFDDPSPTSVALQHCTAPPPPPRELNPNLNEETEAVLLKALSKLPEDRYQTGKELIEALEQALHAGAPGPDRQSVTSGARGPSLSSISTHERVATHLHAQADADASAGTVRPAAMPPRPDVSLMGRQLDEYRLEALLGQGGMARVYRGVDVNLGRRAAIKVIDSPFRADSEYIDRFKREAQAIAKLEHPHIVRLYRYGEVNGLLYMAMQYVDGVDLGVVLADYYRDQAFIEPQRASRIVHEVCLALDYAHEQGIIHRDVKPSNIMLDKQGNVILADFGLALLTELGTRGEIFGSPYYIAPEQAISSANVVPQSDLYAVGIILYEMFAGELPFTAEDPLDVAMQHLSESPRPPRELRPEISPELETVILRALAKDPADRYCTGVELADALDQALGIGDAKTPSPLSPESRSAEPENPPLPLSPAAVAVQARADPAAGRVAGPEKLSLPPRPAAVVEIRSVPAQADVEPAPTRMKPAAPFRGRKWLLIVAGLAIVLCVGVSTLAGIGIVATQILPGRRAPTETPTSVQVAQRTATGTIEPSSTVEPSPTTGGAKPSPTYTSSATSMPTTAPSPTQPSTATSVPTAMPTSTPLPTETPTATSLPTALPTPVPSPTPTATFTPKPPTIHSLLIVARDDEGLFVKNRTEEPFPLASLQLGDGKEMVVGSEWETEALGHEQCVVIWKDKKDPKFPDGLECTPVGTTVIRGKKEAFWKKPFQVYWSEQEVGTCQEKPVECIISISIEQ